MESRLPVDISSDEANEEDLGRETYDEPNESPNEQLGYGETADSPTGGSSSFLLRPRCSRPYESLSPGREPKSPQFYPKSPQFDPKLPQYDPKLGFDNVDDLVFDPIVELGGRGLNQPSTSGLCNEPSAQQLSLDGIRRLKRAAGIFDNSSILRPSTSRKETDSKHEKTMDENIDSSNHDSDDSYTTDKTNQASPVYEPEFDDEDNDGNVEEVMEPQVDVQEEPVAEIETIEHIVYYEPESMEQTSDYEEEIQCVCADDESDITGESSDEELIHLHLSNSDEEPVTPKKRRNESPCAPSSAKRACRMQILQSTDTPAVEVNTESPVGVNAWLEYFTAWTGSERTKAIELLIKKCSAPQIHHMMDTIGPLFQRDFIKNLPKEVALQILKHLSPHDLLQAAQTSGYWRFLSEDNLLWKEQCRRIGITTVSKRIKLMPLKFSSPWKAEYMRNKYIEHKWLTKPMSSAKILKAHDDHVITCLQFYGNIILSGSDDTTLKLWSAVTGKCLRTLIGHTGGVWSSQMYKKTVISGSTDRTLRVWDADSGLCLKILTGHTSTVRCMHLHEDRVVSGSRDATLRVWSVSEGQCLKVLVGHLAAVRCVQYDGKLVVSGAYDYYVKVWNPDSGECLHTLSGHTNRVYSLQFDGQHIVSGSLDTSIIVWDVTSGSVKHTLTGHQSLTSGMELRDNILVSGNADSTVKVWDIITGQCLHTLAGPHKHQSAVTCLQLNNRFVITSSDDGTVKLWDVKTGEFIRNLVTLESGGSGGVVWRIRASQTKLVCAVGSRNGTEETKLMVMNFDVPSTCQACQ